MKYREQFEAETFFHIFNHAVGNESLFKNNENFCFFLKKYNEHTESIWDTFAYCLMPNHFHLLIKVKPIEILEQYQ